MIKARDKATGKVLEGEAAIRALAANTATRLVDGTKPERASMSHRT